MLLLAAIAFAREPSEKNPTCWTKAPSFDSALSPESHHKGPALASDVMLGLSGAMFLVPAALDGRDLLTRVDGSALTPRSAVQLVTVAGGLAPPFAAKGLVCRARPYLVDTKQGYHKPGDDHASFFSGHTATAATASFSTAWWIYDETGRDETVLVVGYVGAGVWTATMGALRVAAGKHYPSDVVLGAISGAAAGILVPIAADSARGALAPVSATATPPLVFQVGAEW